MSPSRESLRGCIPFLRCSAISPLYPRSHRSSPARIAMVQSHVKVNRILCFISHIAISDGFGQLAHKQNVPSPMVCGTTQLLGSNSVLKFLRRSVEAKGARVTLPDTGRVADSIQRHRKVRPQNRTLRNRFMRNFFSWQPQRPSEHHVYQAYTR